MRKIFGSILAGAAMAIVANGADATPITFKVDGATVTTSGLAIGSTVVVSPDPGLAGLTFDLDTAGPSSKTFDFLDVSVSGIGVVGGFIDAVLNFSAPVSGSADGVLGGFAVILGVGSAGVLTVLNDPDPIAFGNGGLFDVDFIGFSSSCVNCTSLSGTVQAKVSLLQAPTSVPEPGTISLLGAGLLALVLSQRRRKLA